MSNAQITNKKVDFMTLVDVYKLLSSSTSGKQCKLFSDNKYYVGVGVRSNKFSVNTKKTKYNIYCGIDEFELLQSLKLSKSTNFIKNGNKCDKVRPHYIECKSTNDFQKMVSCICNQFATIQ